MHQMIVLSEIQEIVTKILFKYNQCLLKAPQLVFEHDEILKSLSDHKESANKFPNFQNIFLAYSQLIIVRTHIECFLG